MPSPGCRPSWVLSGLKATCQLSCERTTIFGAPVVPEVSTAQAALSGSAASNAQVDTGARGTILSGTPPAARIFNAAVRAASASGLCTGVSCKLFWGMLGCVKCAWLGPIEPRGNHGGDDQFE